MADLLDYALCTVADVKELLNIASSDTTKDNLITRKINQATEMIENYTGRRFKLTTYTNEEYDSTGTDQLILRQRPIVGTVTVGSRDSALNDDHWTNYETDRYFTDASSGILEFTSNLYGSWNRYRVTYQAGYATIPSDIAEACATLAAFLVENGYSGSNIKAKTEGQRKLEYFETGAGGTFDDLNIRDILDSYANSPILADV